MEENDKHFAERRSVSLLRVDVIQRNLSCQRGVIAAEKWRALRGHSDRLSAASSRLLAVYRFPVFWYGPCYFSPQEQGVELVKALKLRAAIFDRSPYIKRTVKICLGLTAAVVLPQFYCVRELLFMEVVVALGFVVVALIGAVCALGYIAALWLRRLGPRLKALGALASAGRRQPFAKTTVTGLSQAEEEVS